jgi:hypothetical protein|tara:strand:- start:18856 stop:19464 length:609 start_codon:yes stop_codon:yes gene_type:complete
MTVEQHTWLRKTAWNEKDEYHTPSVLVRPILGYMPDHSTVWCPFDTAHSEFVLLLTEAGHRVIYSHIWHGQDFFTYEPDEPYDCIISNPPFTLKLAVFQRLYGLGKPFAIVMGLPILNYQEVGSFFHRQQLKGNYLQLLIVDKKVSFDGQTSSFNNSFFCYKMLPMDIVFHHLEHNNSRSKFTGSRMKYDVLADPGSHTDEG